MENFKTKWEAQLTKYPKLRTYREFKTMYGMEPYVFKMLTRSERSFLSQLRFGILPIAIEMGRFTIPKTPEQDRICPMCNSNCVETEIHFVTKCSKYDMIRYTLFTKASQFDVNFDNLQPEEQFSILIKDSNLVKPLAKYIQQAYHKRNGTLFN
jgi:hypothetical protein